MIILRIIVSWFYSIGVYIRNMLYHNGILKSTSVDIATICVGNLAVGGTGKTPHTEYIIRLLQDDYKVAVLSRGYKRKTRGIVLADETSTADTIGDEPMQMHLHFPDVPICVSADRVAGVRYIQEHCPEVEVIILDDAYQHRALCCGYNILLTAEERLFVDDHLLPWGRLREHAYRKNQADMVVVTKCPNKMLPIDKRNIDHKLGLASYQYLCFSWMEYGKITNGGWFFKPLVIAGIAHPEAMFEHVKSSYPQAQLLAFGDHHNFSKRDWRKIARTMKKYGCDAIITTEKDAVRLQQSETFMARWGKQMHVLPIQVNLKEFTELFNQNIIRYVKENTRHR